MEELSGRTRVQRRYACIDEYREAYSSFAIPPLYFMLYAILPLLSPSLPPSLPRPAQGCAKGAMCSVQRRSAHKSHLCT